VVVVAAAVKSKVAPVLATVIICERGMSCPKVVLKLRAGIGSSFCARRLEGAASASRTKQRKAHGDRCAAVRR
jgi:hypothetical protein